MRARAGSTAVLVVLVLVLAPAAWAEEFDPLRLAVLLEDGTEADRRPVEEALRAVSGLRVVGPIDRAAPRSSPELEALGESLDVALLVVLSDRGGGLVLRIFEVRRGAYFEGTVDAPFEAEGLRAFVSARAAAARRAAPPLPRARREAGGGGGSNLRLWAGVGIVVVAAGAFAALILFGGSEDAPGTVRVDVVR